MGDGTDTSDTSDDAAKQAANRGCLWIFVAVIALSVLWAMVSPDDEDDSEGPDDFAAIDVCHQEVEEQLRAPATAEWPGDETVTHRGNEYTVSGAVDSENGFGALIRTEWVCTATWVEANRWNPVVAVLLE